VYICKIFSRDGGTPKGERMSPVIDRIDRDPDGDGGSVFRVRITHGDSARTLVLTAGELLSYRRFRSTVLARTGWLSQYDGAAGRRGQMAWDAEIAAAMATEARQDAADGAGGCGDS